MKFRKEKDSLGFVNVREERLWGAQTQRSLENFPKQVELMPLEQIKSLVLVKKAAAIVNNDLEKLDDYRKELIVKACDEILDDKYNDNFPLTIWQTGSGTQTNMDVNEVISNICNKRAEKKLVHPNDHVNMSQSSNDTFPTAMHVASLLQIRKNLLPVLCKMIEKLKELEKENENIIKTGRTHLQDATPLRFSQEISAWTYMLEKDLEEIKNSSKSLEKLAIGATAVGTGINAPKDFGEKVAKKLSQFTKEEFKTDSNKFYQLSSKSDLVSVHSSLKTLASDLYKIAADIRFLSCGPRCGISEINIKANEPGSSIMPGKVNPTQVESLTMICIQVMANDLAISMANSQGQLQLNVYMPLIIYNMLQSIKLLSESITCFTDKLLDGLKANEENIKKNLQASLMLVTSLSPHIGYDKACEIAKNAYKKI